MDERLLILAVAFVVVVVSLLTLVVTVVRSRRAAHVYEDEEPDSAWPMLMPAPHDTQGLSVDAKFAEATSGPASVLHTPLRTGAWRPEPFDAEREAAQQRSDDYWDALIDEPSLLVRPVAPATPAWHPAAPESAPALVPPQPAPAPAPPQPAPTPAPLPPSPLPTAAPVVPSSADVRATLMDVPGRPVETQEPEVWAASIMESLDAETPIDAPTPDQAFSVTSGMSIRESFTAQAQDVPTPPAMVGPPMHGVVLEEPVEEGIAFAEASVSAAPPADRSEALPENPTEMSAEPDAGASVDGGEPEPAELGPAAVAIKEEAGARPEPMMQTEAPAVDIPEHVLVAPVEMWFGDHRVGVRKGTRTYELFQRYARVLFDDLKKAREDVTVAGR